MHGRLAPTEAGMGLLNPGPWLERLRLNCRSFHVASARLLYSDPVHALTMAVTGSLSARGYHLPSREPLATVKVLYRHLLLAVKNAAPILA